MPAVSGCSNPVRCASTSHAPSLAVVAAAPLQHAAIDDQLALKQRTLGEQLARLAELKPERWAEPLTGPAFGYRRRARLAVRWHTRDKRLEVGFRSTASQDIVAIDQCPVLVQPLQTLLPGLLEALHGLTKPQAIGHVLFSGTAEPC